jgi:transposase
MFRSIHLPAADQICDLCGGELHEMAGQFEEPELVDVVDVSYHLKKVMRQKYACACGGCIKTAPGPERTVVGGRYSLDVAIKIIIDKYLYHLPLARQARIMVEHGLAITPQTLWDQLYVISERLKITVAGLIKHVMRARRIRAPTAHSSGIRAARARTESGSPSVDGTVRASASDISEGGV